MTDVSIYLFIVLKNVISGYLLQVRQEHHRGHGLLQRSPIVQRHKRPQDYVGLCGREFAGLPQSSSGGG